MGPGALRGLGSSLSGACWRLEEGFSPGKVKEPLVKSLLIESRVSPDRFGCGKTALCGDDVLNGGSFSPGKILPMADFGGVAGDAKFSSFPSSFQEELAEQ